MDFQTAIKTCLNKYVVFSGRASRPEYWYFVLFGVLAGIVANIVDTALFGGGFRGATPIHSLTSLALLLPTLAVSVRRLHDLDRSGWWVLLAFVPVIGWIVLLIWYVSRGTIGPNRFGDDSI